MSFKIKAEHQPNFIRLWVGQTISLFGSQIGGSAMRYAALFVLAVAPEQMAWLSIAAMLPALIFGLPAGFIADRFNRRRLLIATDLIRGLLCLIVPIAYLLGLLRIELLYLIVALTGICSILFESCYHAFVPAVVGRDELVEANSRLSISESLAEIIGPPAGGLLVQVISAPLAIFADACSFFCSALAIGAIPIQIEPEATEERSEPLAEMIEGLHWIWRDLRLRALFVTALSQGVAGGLIGPMYDLFLVRDLGFSPFLVGITIGVGGIGSLIGAAVAQRVVVRFGIGKTLIGSLLIGCCSSLLIPFAYGPWALVMVCIAQIADVVQTIFAIHAISIRQTVVPDRVLGRVSAVFGLAPIAATLVGAILTSQLVMLIGVRAIIAGGILCALGALAAIWFSPLARLKQLER